MTLLKDNNYKDINIALLSLEADIKNKIAGLDTTVIDRQLAEINSRIDKINAGGNNNSSALINDIRAEVEDIEYHIEDIDSQIESIEQKLSEIFLAENLVTDFNTTTDAGVYYWKSTATNKPAAGYGVLLVNKAIDGSSTWINQIAYGTNGRIYFRQKINNDNWGGWNTIAYLDETRTNADQGYLCKLYQLESATGDATTQANNVILLGKIPDPASTASPATPSASWDIDVDFYFVRPAGHRAAWCNVKAGYGYCNAWRKYGLIEAFGVDVRTNNKYPFYLVTVKYNNEYYIGVRHTMDIDGGYAARVKYVNQGGNRNPISFEVNGSMVNALKVIPYLKVNGTVLNTEVWNSIVTFPNTYAPTVQRNGSLVLANDNDVDLTSFGNEPLSIGTSSGANLGIDTNEIQARNNGKASPLYLNSEGGAVEVGSGSVSGAKLVIHGNTVGSNSYADTNPKLEFKNRDESQNISLTFTDFDSVQAPASLTLNGNQGNEYFIAPNIKATGKFVGNLNGKADTADRANRLKCTAWNNPYVYEATYGVRVNVYKITMPSTFNSILVQIYDDANYARSRRYVLNLWHATNYGYNVSVTDLGGTIDDGLRVWLGNDGNVYLESNVYWTSRISFSYLDDFPDVTTTFIGYASYGSNKDINGNVLFTPLADPIINCGALRGAPSLTSVSKQLQYLKTDVLRSTSKLIIPIGAPDTLEDGCIWIER